MPDETRKRIAALSEEQRRILARRLRARKDGTAFPGIAAQPRKENRFPLSFAQQRLWFLDQLVADSPSFILNASYRLLGRLNNEALQKSLAALVSRHEILRTTVETVAGEPWQVIDASLKTEIHIVDFTETPIVDRELALQRFVSDECHRPFDLGKGPLFRAHLIKLTDEEHVLLLVMHHIVTDAWSMGLLFEDLSQFYSAFARNEKPEPSPLPIQYADFCCWQRQYLTGEKLANLLGYWRGQLDNLPTMGLPLDRPRPAVQGFTGRRELLSLPKPIGEAVKELGRHEGATLFMTLLAVFALLLNRYSGEEEIVVGVPIANRTRPEIEKVVGFFVNMLVMRLTVSSKVNSFELLRQVRQVALDAFEHQDLPFEKLVEELHPQRDLSRNPLFQVTFALQNAPMTPLSLQELKLSIIEQELMTTRFDLEMNVWEHPEGLVLSLIYNTSLFEKETMQRLLRHYQRLLEEVVAAPGRNVTELSMLTDAEQQALVHWNNTAIPLAPATTVVSLFAEQARVRGGKLAAVCGGSSLTYEELDRRATRLAGYLMRNGVGPEVPVCICLPRCLELIVTVLGVVKAGGAYVPLDPKYPAERLRFMLEDSGAPLLLTGASMQTSFSGTQARTIAIDTQWPTIEAQAVTVTCPEILSQHLCYIIYTSGSTGKPKGVAVSHAALLNLVSWHQRFYEISPASRATMVAGVGFDASAWELWPYLTGGACLFLADEAVLHSPRELIGWLGESGITTAFLPTALAEIALQEATCRHLALRTMLTGGDKLRCPPPTGLPFELINHYGPTEGTVVSTAGAVRPDSLDGRPPSIGRPIDNVQAYILDTSLQPVPVGVAGELYLAGDSLARGYLHRPDLTAERFIPNPFSESAGTRMYATGDLVRYQAAGSIEFLGRRDQQVKVRGMRIELGEIESTLAGFDAVKDAIVVCREEISGDNRLVAYVVFDLQAGDATRELRAFVRQRLPDSMIPAVFVVLDSMPLTPNGKVDRSRLPAPPSERLPDQTFSPPASDAEKTLASIWQDLLRLDKIGLNDNFFDLGGHSLLVMQAIARFHEKTGVQLHPLDFYPQSLGQLAAGGAGGKVQSPPPAAPQEAIEPCFFGTEARTLFGIYRPAASPTGHAVVICPPHAHEYIRCHHGLRELAWRLARVGCHVLSFDYFGSGDSGGEYQEGSLNGWQQDIDRAVDAIKAKFMLRHVSLVGLRLGADLALMAGANRHDIDRLVLWDPILHGQELIDEMLTLQGPLAAPPPYPDESGGYDVLGYPLTSTFLQELRKLEMTALHPPARCSILAIENTPENSGDLAGWVASNSIAAHYQRFAETKIWRRNPDEKIVPQRTLKYIVDWLGRIKS